MSSLKHALQIAKERVDRQTAWNALSVKTPAFSPWAPYGYARLVQQVNQAEEIIHKFDSRESSIIEKRNLIAHIQNTH